MNTFDRSCSRRDFVKQLVAGAAGVGLLPLLGHAASKDAFSFVLLGDLHFDLLECHDLDLLQKEKPDDLRQVREYSRLTTDILPRLFATVRETIAALDRSPDTRAAMIVQVGDLVEGLCANAEASRQLDVEALDFVRRAALGAPFLLTKGNHDITGPGALEAFQNIIQPFIGEQSALLSRDGQLSAARCVFQYRNALFCFFDAYDKESLAWLEAVLARRTAQHCFVVLHPPVVPYGARATWHLFSAQRDKAQRERLLELLGKHNAVVLTGHIHKYSMLVRSTPGAGRFLQLGICSVINDPLARPQHVLSGVKRYNIEQVNVEPDFSPATKTQRQAVYQAEAPFVRQFQYANLPGYALVRVDGSRITASIHSGVGPRVWRALNLTKLLEV